MFLIVGDLIAATWVFTWDAIEDQRRGIVGHVEARVAN